MMSLEEPPAVLLRALYLAWLALRAASFFLASSAAAALAFLAASAFFLARSLAFCAAAAAFLRSASCFAFIALRRASVSMVLPAETEKPALTLALKACTWEAGTGRSQHSRRLNHPSLGRVCASPRNIRLRDADKKSTRSGRRRTLGRPDGPVGSPSSDGDDVERPVEETGIGSRASRVLRG